MISVCTISHICRVLVLMVAKHLSRSQPVERPHASTPGFHQDSTVTQIKLAMECPDILLEQAELPNQQ